MIKCKFKTDWLTITFYQKHLKPTSIVEDRSCLSSHHSEELKLFTDNFIQHFKCGECEQKLTTLIDHQNLHTTQKGKKIRKKYHTTNNTRTITAL